MMGRMQVNGFRDLVRKAQAGDPAALDELFRGVVPFVERVVAGPAHPVRPGESVSDRRQDVCRRVFEKLAQFRGAAEAPDDEQAWALFRVWVRRVAHGVILNAQRDSGRPPTVPLRTDGAGESTNHGAAPDPAAPDGTPSSNLRGEERARLVLEALDHLPDLQDREIVRLRFFEGLSLRQVAGRLQLSYDKVRERFRFSVRRLQQYLEELR
jgi:RNA polymerase sigma factor (sigma-70 family)